MNISFVQLHIRWRRYGSIQHVYMFLSSPTDLTLTVLQEHVFTDGRLSCLKGQIVVFLCDWGWERAGESPNFPSRFPLVTLGHSDCFWAETVDIVFSFSLNTTQFKKYTKCIRGNAQLLVSWKHFLIFVLKGKLHRLIPLSCFLLIRNHNQCGIFGSKLHFFCNNSSRVLPVYPTDSEYTVNLVYWWFLVAQNKNISCVFALWHEKAFTAEVVWLSF